ncbi:hypothetical protein F4680DRAFT_432874 [Xylaria scruposa]|nr:hypothetical protein F4680DRAFT_432874 [Xylaria scruposa]
MHLHDLVPELLFLILQALDDPRDLQSVIKASAQCFRVYARSQGLILSSVLKNAILPEALHHAVACERIPATPSDPRLQQIQPLEAFLDKYFQANSFELPTGYPTAVALCRLYSQISYFIDDYSTRAMRALDLEPDAGRTMALLALSSTERARLQRAFFRYELYCRVFPVKHDARYCSLVPAKAQFTQFLARIQPWEAEEMCCVHHYFTSLIGSFMDDLEDQVVEAVLTTPGVRRPPGLARSPSPSPAKRRRIRAPTTAGGLVDDSSVHSEPIHTDDWRSRADNSDMVFFDHLDLRDLDLFSRDGRFRSSNFISYLASLGSAFVYQLVLANKNQRKDMIRENTPVWRDFLPEALDCAPDTGTKTVVPDEIDGNHPSRPNLGYFWFKHSEQDVYSHIHHAGTLNCPLRERAFVFWDAERILCPQVNNNLRKARYVNPRKVNLLFNRYKGKSAEERLEGVMIPKAQMESIIEEFGSVFDSW